MSFGWSVGDLLAAIGVIKDVVIALQEAGGAKDDYQSTTSTLNDVNDVLVFVQSCTTSTRLSLDQKTAESLKEKATAIKQPIQNFLDDIKGFEKALGSSSSSSNAPASTGIRARIRNSQWWRSPDKKIRWAFFVSGEAEKLMKMILPRMQTLQMLQQQISLSTVMGIKDKVANLEDAATILQNNIGDLSDDTSTGLKSVITRIEDLKEASSNLLNSDQNQAADLKTILGQLANIDILRRNVSSNLDTLQNLIAQSPKDTALTTNIQQSLHNLQAKVEQLEQIIPMTSKLEVHFNSMTNKFANMTIAVKAIKHQLDLQQAHSATNLPKVPPGPEKTVLDSWDLAELLDDYMPVTQTPHRFAWRLPRTFNWTGTKGSRFLISNSNSDTPLYEKIGEPIGMGASGLIKAMKVQGETIAVKQVRREEEQFQTIRECILLAKISHQHIVQVVGACIDPDYLYIIEYPLARNGDLESFLRTKPETESKFWIRTLTSNIGCLANAVAFLHSKEVGILHGDIKPRNVLVHGSIMILTDFGISSHRGSAPITEPYGTLGYMAPELFERRFVGFQRDVYSLGLVFWLMMDKIVNSSEEGIIGRFEGYIPNQDDLSFKDLLGRLANNAFPFKPFHYTTSSIKDNFHDDNGDEELPYTEVSGVLERYYDMDSDGCSSKFIRLMTSRSPENRPSSALVSTFFQYEGWDGIFCGDCCAGVKAYNPKTSTMMLQKIKIAHQRFPEYWNEYELL